MIVFKVKNRLEEKKMSRYKLQQITNWNKKRINAFYFSRVKKVTMEELEKLCEIFDCELSDIITLKKEMN